MKKSTCLDSALISLRGSSFASGVTECGTRHELSTYFSSVWSFSFLARRGFFQMIQERIDTFSVVSRSTTTFRVVFCQLLRSRLFLVVRDGMYFVRLEYSRSHFVTSSPLQSPSFSGSQLSQSCQSRFSVMCTRDFDEICCNISPSIRSLNTTHNFNFLENQQRCPNSHVDNANGSSQTIILQCLRCVRACVEGCPLLVACRNASTGNLGVCGTEFLSNFYGHCFNQRPRSRPHISTLSDYGRSSLSLKLSPSP